MTGQPPATGHTGTGLPPGTRLNDIYEIDTVIASGGMGEIYRARNIHTDDPVAIKFIRSDGPESDTVRSLFRKEATALNRLHDKAIVRYYGFAVDPTLGRPYIAMEYVAGRPLSELIAAHALSLADVCRLGIRVAEGMEVAHREGIIHRDLSPDNILLPESRVDTAKIIDFGIARETQSAHSIINGNVAGKYAYMSPEQLGLAGGDVQVTSDIYSLGLVLAEAAGGHALEMRGSMAEMVARRMRVPDISHLDPHITPLIAAMLQPVPSERPASMAHVAHWLRDILDSVARESSVPGGGTIAITAPPANPSRRPASTGRPPVTPILPSQVLSDLMADADGTVAAGTDMAHGAAPFRKSAPTPVGRAPATGRASAIPPPPAAHPGAVPGANTSRRTARWGALSAGLLLVLGAAGGVAWWLRPPAPAPEAVVTPAAAPPWTATALDASGLAALADPRPGTPADCLLVVPFAVDDWHLSAEGFAADPAPIARLRSSFASRYGFEPDIRPRQIGAAQCPALELTRRLAGPLSPDLRLELAGAPVAGPARIAGAARAPTGSQLTILAVDGNGQARLLSPTAPLDGGGQVFSVARTATDTTPELVVAVASDRPMPELAPDRPEPAADLFARIEREARSTGARLGVRIALASSP